MRFGALPFSTNGMYRGTITETDKENITMSPYLYCELEPGRQENLT